MNKIDADLIKTRTKILFLECSEMNWLDGRKRTAHRWMLLAYRKLRKNNEWDAAEFVDGVLGDLCQNKSLR